LYHWRYNGYAVFVTNSYAYAVLPNGSISNASPIPGNNPLMCTGYIGSQSIAIIVYHSGNTLISNVSQVSLDSVTFGVGGATISNNAAALACGDGEAIVAMQDKTYYSINLATITSADQQQGTSSQPATGGAYVPTNNTFLFATGGSTTLFDATTMTEQSQAAASSNLPSLPHPNHTMPLSTFIYTGAITYVTSNLKYAKIYVSTSGNGNTIYYSDYLEGMKDYKLKNIYKIITILTFFKIRLYFRVPIYSFHHIVIHSLKSCFRC
jgi:hypothetical protein